MRGLVGERTSGSKWVPFSLPVLREIVLCESSWVTEEFVDIWVMYHPGCLI